MSLRVWLQPFVVGGALAWNLVPTAGAFAQQPAPSQPGTTPSATSSAAAAQDVPTLPETEVVAEPPAPNLAPNFEPFVTPQTVFTSNAFQSPPAEGYFASGATAGSIVAIPNLRFPGTVNTVTEEMIQDQQAISFSDILRDVGGAVQTNGDNLRPDRGRRSASAWDTFTSASDAAITRRRSACSRTIVGTSASSGPTAAGIERVRRKRARRALRDRVDQPLPGLSGRTDQLPVSTGCDILAPVDVRALRKFRSTGGATMMAAVRIVVRRRLSRGSLCRASFA